MAKIKNKLTGEVKEIQEHELHQYGLGGMINELPKAKSGIKIKPENRGKFNATKKATGKTTEELTHSKNLVTKKRAIFAQNASHWKHENGGYLPLAEWGTLNQNPLNLTNPQNNQEQISLGANPNNIIQNPNTYNPNTVGDYFDESKYQVNNDTFYDPTQNNQINPNVIDPGNNVVNTPEFNPQLTQSVVDYNHQMGRGKTNVYGTPDELSQITSPKQKSYNWTGNIPSFTGIGGNSYLAKGVAQMGSGLVNIGKGSLDIFGNQKLANREKFRNAKQFGQSVYADADNKPQGQIYGKDVRGGNALFKFGGQINNNMIHAPEMGGYFKKKIK